MNLQRIPHLDGDPGVAQTISQMRRLIEEGKKDPLVHQTAAKILTTARVPAFAWEQEARAIFDWVRRNIRFTRDVDGHETLHGAADIIQLGIGDCDDFTVLMLSLAGSIGAAGRIVTISTDHGADREFTHVYPEVEVNGRWISLDAARLHPAFGKSPEHFTRKRVWSLDPSEGYADMSGLGPVGSIAPGQGPQGAWRADVFPPFRNAAGLRAGGMGSYLRGPVVPPPSQRRTRVPQGFGNYGPAAARKLGQDNVDWSGISQAITTATQGTANIIRAENTPSYSTALPAGYSYNSSGQLVPTGTVLAPSLATETILGIPVLDVALLAIILFAVRN
jgi:Transglutaminase-like superfamily